MAVGRRRGTDMMAGEYDDQPQTPKPPTVFPETGDMRPPGGAVVFPETGDMRPPAMSPYDQKNPPPAINMDLFRRAGGDPNAVRLPPPPLPPATERPPTIEEVPGYTGKGGVDDSILPRPAQTPIGQKPDIDPFAPRGPLLGANTQSAPSLSSAPSPVAMQTPAPIVARRRGTVRPAMGNAPIGASITDPSGSILSQLAQLFGRR